MMNVVFLSRGAALAVCAAALAACSPQGGSASSGPKDFTQGDSCALDGMLLADYPGPKGQIHFGGGDAEPIAWYCDTMELLSELKKPEQLRPITAAYVQDMAKADWQSPRGQWVDAKSAFYVLGSKKHGSMGPTAASFATPADAAAFAKAHGGTVKAFADLTVGDVDLTGGALHDERM